MRTLFLHPHLLFATVLVGFLILLPLRHRGQASGVVPPLQVAGPIPDDFLLSPSEKYAQAVEAIDQDERRQLRKAKETFYGESFYYVNQLLLSGKVLFNDSVSQYLADLGDYLLRDQPALRHQLRFYAVKSTTANAFASNSGIIFVNLGLMARLENEAQLAFILCHEISHYLSRHPLDIYLETQSIEKDAAALFHSTKWEEIMLAQNTYSREKELEADLQGLELYLRSDYAPTALGGVFDILKFPQAPPAYVPYDPTVIGVDTALLPTSLLTGHVPDSAVSWTAPALTHPSPDDRKQALERVIQAADPPLSTALYVHSPERFQRIRLMSRYELCELYVLARQYETALYHAFLLKTAGHWDLRLAKLSAHALYGLARYSNAGKFWDVHLPVEEVRTHPPLLNQLMEQLQGEGLTIVAMLYQWKVYQLAPHDEELPLMLEDLMVEFSQVYYATDSARAFLHALLTRHRLPRQEILQVQDVLFNAMGDSRFSALLLDAMARASSPALPPRSPSSEQLALEGVTLGLDKVVFVDPYFQAVDLRSYERPVIAGTDSREAAFIDALGTHADALGLSHALLSSRRLEAEGVSLFQELGVLSEWAQDANQHDNLQLVNFRHAEVQPLIDKYGTSYFVWSSTTALTRPRSGKLLVLSAGLLLPILLPYSVYYATTPAHHSLQYTLVFDLRQGKRLLKYPKFVRMKDSEDVMNSLVYDLLIQLKAAP